MSDYSSPYTGPTNEETVSEKMGRIQYEWDLALKLLDNGHRPSGDGGTRNCPRCFNSVNYWFTSQHDLWHVKLNRRIQMAGSLFGAGLLGYEEV